MKKSTCLIKKLLCALLFTFAVNVTAQCNVSVNLSATNGNFGVVNFQATATGASTIYYFWYFGDNKQGFSSTASMPHTYMNGTYMATVIATTGTAITNCSDTAQVLVTVTNATCNLVANATASYAPNGSVQFINTSTGTTSATTYTWDFGNGQLSNAANPFVTYPSAGIYNVNLYMDNGFNCYSTKFFTVNVTNIPCLANANFTLIPSGQPQHWLALPAFAWNISNAIWNWGDNSVPSPTAGIFDSHTYSAAGLYSICLTVTASCGATATVCSSYSIFRTSQSSQMVHINVQNPPMQNIDGLNPTIITTTELNNDINIYPNPSQGLLNVYLSASDNESAEINIYNLLGDRISHSKATAQDGIIRQEIKLNDAEDGIYLLKVRRERSEVVQKIVLKK